MPEETVDPAALGELLETIGGDREFLVELIETYLSDSPTLIAELRAGLASGDAAVVRRAAHTLKSTSVTFGASGLATTCREIEAAAAAADLAGLGPRADRAAVEYEAVAAQLRAIAVAGGPA